MPTPTFHEQQQLTGLMGGDQGGSDKTGDLPQETAICALAESGEFRKTQEVLMAFVEKRFSATQPFGLELVMEAFCFFVVDGGCICIKSWHFAGCFGTSQV